MSGRATVGSGLALALGALTSGALALGAAGCERAPDVRVTLIPGQSVWEHAGRLTGLAPGARDELLALAADERFARDELGLGALLGPARAPRSDGVQATWIEGFLYPETYFFRPEASARDVVTRAVRQFQKVWGELRAAHAADLARLAGLGLDEHALIVLASLVEEETQEPTEAPTIAGVFMNRIAQGMRLETDPTLMYRPDRVARAPTPTERRDASNPYNTYAIKGLPPGPICSPGRNALLAVLQPETHTHVFFVARRDGSRRHAFAATLAEHEANIDRYLRRAAPSPEAVEPPPKGAPDAGGSPPSP